VTESEDRLIRVPDAAKRIGICVRLVWEMLSKGVFTRHRIPGHRCTVLSLREVDDYIERVKGGEHATVS
jgi:predicted DNA-binding transcriptional regulator AlpA